MEVILLLMALLKDYFHFFFFLIFIYLFGCLESWLRHAGSFVVVCGLSCSVACGILVPQPGITPASHALQGRFVIVGPPGKSLDSFHSCCWKPYYLKQRHFCCSVARYCPILCDPMDCSTLGFPVLHCLPELAPTHVQ